MNNVTDRMQRIHVLWLERIKPSGCPQYGKGEQCSKNMSSFYNLRTRLSHCYGFYFVCSSSNINVIVHQIIPHSFRHKECHRMSYQLSFNTAMKIKIIWKFSRDFTEDHPNWALHITSMFNVSSYQVVPIPIGLDLHTLTEKRKHSTVAKVNEGLYSKNLNILVFLKHYFLTTFNTCDWTCKKWYFLKVNVSIFNLQNSNFII